MASLKEIKGRIASVKSTQKITSAMKMVASAKLRKAQYQTECFSPYQSHLNRLMDNFLASLTGFSSAFSETREVKRIALVVLSSNSSLCGAFNSNIIHLMNKRIAAYSQLSGHDIDIYPVGKKVEDACRKAELNVQGSFIELMDKPHFEGARNLADHLVNDFMEGKIDKVEIIYNHFRSTAVQIPTVDLFLPLEWPETNESAQTLAIDYIVEPNKAAILESLIPKSFRTKIYAVLLDSAAAEQAARTVAMQIATDNASDILDGLTIQYNKQRQQAITSELLDIVGGSEALK